MTLTAWSRKSRFPHMSPEDSAVWSRYLSLHPSTAASCEYDVHVGSSTLTDSDFDPSLVGMWETLRQKRIDVVVDCGEFLEVVEVKPILNMSALGQVLCYCLLLSDRLTVGKPVCGVIVCGVIDPDVERVCDRFGVKVRVV